MSSFIEAWDATLERLGRTDSRDGAGGALRVAVDGGDFQDADLDSTLDAGRQLVVFVAVGVLQPGAFPDGAEALGRLLENVDAESVLDDELATAWLMSVAGAGRTELAVALASVYRHAALLPVIRARIAVGDVAAARRLSEAIAPYDKRARGLALLELALAGDGSVDEALAAVMHSPRVESGPDRGGAELFALAAMVEQLMSAEACPKQAAPLVAAMASLGQQGQYRTRPTGFAVLLADAAVRLCEHAAESGWLDHAEALRGAIVFADIAAQVDVPLRAARARVDAGKAPPSLESIAPSRPAPPPSWRVESDQTRRLRRATAVMADARGSLERYLDALAVGLDPDGPTDAERLAAWQRAGGSEAERLLITYVEANDTEEERWCITGPAEPWDAVADVTDACVADAIVKAILTKDYATRSYGDWRRPVPLSRGLAVLIGRFGRRDWLEQILRAFARSSRPRIDERLHDLFESLPATFELDPGACAELLPPHLRPALWGAAGQLTDNSLDELRALFGDPSPTSLHAVCEALARAGRVDDAIVLSEHDLDRPTSREGRELLPPPTQAAVMAIARSRVPLTAAQRKALTARLKAAPRRRGDGHSKRVKELRELLKAAEAMPFAGRRGV
ncbi:MAG: hypothetical protein VYE22_01325 [Myxococcota bacterium]|nr:hypothetical protein [Myxococcota bacterium]